jgi:hypothetical protein
MTTETKTIISDLNIYLQPVRLITFWSVLQMTIAAPARSIWKKLIFAVNA